MTRRQYRALCAERDNGIYRGDWQPCVRSFAHAAFHLAINMKTPDYKRWMFRVARGAVS